MQIPSDLSISTIRFYPPDALPDTIFIGYQKQVSAGLAIGKNVCQGAFKSILAFGYSGTGKSKFPIFLTKRLNDDYHCEFSFASIRCQKAFDELILANHSAETLRQDLQKLSEKMKNKPTVLCLDEIDGVRYSVNNSLLGELTMHELSQGILGQWIRQHLRNRVPRVLVFGVSDYPDVIESSIIKHFETPLYFEPTDQKIVEEIIKEILQIDRYKEIAEKAILRLEKHSMQPISAEFFEACNYVKQKAQTNLNDLSEEEILGLFMTYFCPCGATKLIHEYQDKYKSLIDHSRHHTLPYWTSVYEQDITS